MIFKAKINKTSFNGETIKLDGKFLELGDVAPTVRLVSPELEDKMIGEESNNAQLIIVLPTLDKELHDKEAKHFNELVAKVPNLQTCIITMDLPFAQARYKSTTNLENISLLSDFRNKTFSKAYGVLIKDGILEGLCAKAIFIISKDKRIVYKQIVANLENEPNYEEALEKTRGAATSGASCCGFCQ